MPLPARPVEDFDPARYMGLWYEIARIDHAGEYGMSDVQAQYTPLPDGTVQVVNSGYDQDGLWRERRGVAVQCDDPSVGTFGVSFRPPYAAVYNVIAVDRVGYRWALVTTDDRDHLWLLSRTPTMDAVTRECLLERATRMGFDVSRLLWRGSRA